MLGVDRGVCIAPLEYKKGENQVAVELMEEEDW
jgi:hypothetical protein